jgi:hypothetical protein
MSPLSDEGNVADLNPGVDDVDDWVDYSDMILLTDKWLSEVGDMPLAEDLNRDGVVDFKDFATLVHNWHPPLPPLLWDMEPHATSTTTIAMSVVIALPSGESVEYYFDCNSPGGHDSDWQDEPAYTDTGLDPNTEYTYRAAARKATGETVYSDWRSARTPPVPPTIWDMEPRATSTRTIAMSVVAVPGGEYYFDCNSPGGHDSGWQDEPAYTDTGLDPDTEYTYRARTRNTAWSDWRSARTAADLEPPSPDPATWATEPRAVSLASIRMEATIASDESGVEYYFDCTSNSTYSSTWQDSPVYQPTSLPRDMYSFVVRVRDKAPSHNTTGDSTKVTVDLKPPTPNPATWATEPYASSATSIRMVATTASDDSGVEYSFRCTSNPVYSSTWQDSRVYQVTSLPKGNYSFVVRVRDKAPIRNTTGDSTEITVDLTPPAPDPMQWAPGGQPRKVYRGGGPFDYWAEMTAAVATDAGGGPVQYYFECDEDPGIWPSGFSSGWQSERTWEVQLGGQHVLRSFRVKARDQFGNETGFSSTVTAL